MDLKSFVKALVETESPSHDKAAVDRVGAIVAEEAHRLGAQVETLSNTDAGDHVLAQFSKGGGDKGQGQKSILLLCHMDTVFPLGTLSRMPYREEQGVIFGPGVLDMKAGIVIGLAAIEAALQRGMTRPVTLLCTSDEETGSQTSRRWIESLAREFGARCWCSSLPCRMDRSRPGARAWVISQ